MKELRLDDKLNFVEEPVEIMDREVKQLKQSRIPIVKVRWNSKRGPEFTWEREDQIHANSKPDQGRSNKEELSKFEVKNQEKETLEVVSRQLVEGSEKRAEDSTKRAGTELEQEVAKKQKVDDAKVDDDQEEARMKELMNIVPDEEEVAINAIPLATKPPCIVDWKIIKEGKISQFQIRRADGSSKRYSAFIHMLMNFDREDLETLWKLVKAKHGSTRPEEGYERSTLSEVAIYAYLYAGREKGRIVRIKSFIRLFGITAALIKVSAAQEERKENLLLQKPDHVIASSESMNSSKNMLRFSSNDMVHNHYLEEAKKKTQKGIRNSKPSVLPSRAQSTTNGSKPKPRCDKQTSRSFPVNSRAKVQSNKTRKNNKLVEQKSHTQKPGRQIFTGHMFSLNKSSAVYEKTSPRSDLRWKPTELESLFGSLFDEYFNGETQVVSKSFVVTTADASDKRQQQPDSTSSTSTLATTVTDDGNFDL
ncbi:hypothetical protein Tco_0550390 [Tanacetum coccineum]